MLNRRDFLKHVAGGLVTASGLPLAARPVSAVEFAPALAGLPQGAVEAAVLEALPGKMPLIKRTYRPPNYETPIEYFKELYTPSDAFFVRYHFAPVPEVDAQEWRLRVDGEGIKQPLEFSLAELRRDFEQVEVAAVCQCAGNRRGLFQPHVAGVQWGHGAMGHARWRGVRLRDLLNKAGIKIESIEVTFDGADAGAIKKMPDFIKSLPICKARDEHTIIAFEMNGETLPRWNGYPARLVVPGWTATYWVKHLTNITVLSKPFDGFWMRTGYRIPKGLFPNKNRFQTQEDQTSGPITDMLVNSLILHPAEGQSFSLGQPVEVKGVAWDGGRGIRRVAVSPDDGGNWRESELGEDLGRFAWRTWRFVFKPEKRGMCTLLAKAANHLGETQPFEYVPNPAGYHHNAVQRVRIEVV